jgi:hypothetical protein
MWGADVSGVGPASDLGSDRTGRSVARPLVYSARAGLGALALIALNSMTISAARAVDFEVQEATVEKGEAELEYRGSIFDGQPRVEEDDEDEAPLDHSHDVEFQYGLTDRIGISFTGVLDEPVNDDLRLSVAEVGVQYEVFERDTSALSFQFEYGFATIGDTPDELAFGPLVEFDVGPFHTTANLFLTGQVGDAAETDAPGFEYALRVARPLSKRWSLGVDAFGEIEDLSHAGSFEDQEHYIGPMIFWGDNEEDEEGDDRDNEIAEGPEFSWSAGVVFGATDVTSDVVYRVNASLEF